MADSTFIEKFQLEKSKLEKKNMPIPVTEDEALSEDNFFQDVLTYDFLIPLSPERICDLFPVALNIDDTEKQEKRKRKVVHNRKK